MTSPLTDQQLDGIEARADAATPGTWTAVELPPNEHDPRPVYWVKTEYIDEDGCTTRQTVADAPWRMADAEYIAAMRPEVAKILVTEARRLRAELAATRTNSLTTEADELVAHCPEHGSRDTVWMNCHCDVAADMRRRALVPTSVASEGGAL
ncbi:hypothetical protein D0Z67_29355 (plasmid) [Streptomyces seoulensis]|uniref:Uncharacterized protein n=1 Tax=Streptomyces seoulensis TaxID=73044 RepID=A0A4P6U555_STRSO|nr:hypothetical protein [Streptomyces seoulensis]QBJ94477.1 hypothetical protein D0Z67_29355 [Streptomyces seoulensis]